MLAQFKHKGLVYHLGAMQINYYIHNPELRVVRSVFRDVIPMLIIPKKESPYTKIVIGYHWEFQPSPDPEKFVWMHDAHKGAGMDGLDTYHFTPTPLQIKIPGNAILLPGQESI